MNELIKNIIQDTKVKLTEEFDRNFETKSFFGAPWSASKAPNHKGTLMMRTGALRKSIRSKVSGTTITWSSSLPYAGIHNEGGEIEVTAKMKRFFWAMYYKSAGAVSYSIKKKAANNTQRNQRLSAEANYWKSLALMKVGAKLKIEKRQFIGDHPQVGVIINHVMAAHTPDIENYIKNHLKPKK
jgi:phage gpG-like protein